MDVDDRRRRIRGSLLAGAVGDALGAPVEFLTLAEIRANQGPAGVTGYLPAYGRAGGAITDDTQMTLFTAEGLIRARQRGDGADAPAFVLGAYRRWLRTQGHDPPGRPPDGSGWLAGIEGLYRRRAPGHTCVTALSTEQRGTMAKPINDSKGCGGVMRVAPVGLSGDGDAFGSAAACAALTHGHPSGYLPAGVFGAVIGELLTGRSLEDALDNATDQLRTFAGHHETLTSLAAARDLAASGEDPTPERLESLGGGWVGEQALAIAVYCALVAADLPAGLLLAVNHSGDTDSTASIAGNLLGTVHGVDAIPEPLLADLELRDVITTVADDLTDVFHGGGVDRTDGRYPGT